MVHALVWLLLIEMDDRNCVHAQHIWQSEHFDVWVVPTISHHKDFSLSFLKKNIVLIVGIVKEIY